MKESIITYFGQKAKVNCDGNCNKAWGRNLRQRDSHDKMIIDSELGTAPINPGTIEGQDVKPISSDKFPNKWYVRECERCNISKPGEWELDLEIIEF
jgi:hypothetical protein